jgi:hypothetical protein
MRTEIPRRTILVPRYARMHQSSPWRGLRCVALVTLAGDGLWPSRNIGRRRYFAYGERRRGRPSQF